MPIRQRFRTRPKRRLYGFVDGVVAANPDSKFSREILLLDCVDAENFDANPETLREDGALSLVRAQSTRNRWSSLGLNEPVNEGDWVELELAASPRFPVAWQMPAINAYEPDPRTNVTKIRRLPDPPAGAPQGGDGPRSKLDQFCQLLPDEKSRAVEVEGWLATDINYLKVKALDVGQASCTAVSVAWDFDDVIFFFDVGAPLYRNQKSFPKNFRLPQISQIACVVLSHWDFDHFALALKYPEALTALTWYAPDQKVGPSALRLQRMIGSKLQFIDGDMAAQPHIALRRGTSTGINDRNGSGYTLRLETDQGVALLTGDCDFTHIPAAQQLGVTSMTIPHHGGAGSLPGGPTGGNRRAVASYGNPNCYRHPSEAHLAAISGLGWVVQRTASHRRQRRRSRDLIP